ncbi:MAG: hypothetical protein JEZ07_10875 [Phycisphaerae bacterium]|nr:hypothetical protein [Phycisphaerae bacterium]
MIDLYNDIPKKEGCLDIFPESHGDNQVSICLIGDPDGLRYLAKLLNWLADFDQSNNSDMEGSREHIHLHSNNQLGNHSCEVEICRADAKGSGMLPDFMRG